MLAHVELIKPREKLSGYEPPSKAATLPELAAAARAGQIVWKVSRKSVNWRRPASHRRLQFQEVQIKCSNPVGSTRDWWFVWVLG